MEPEFDFRPDWWVANPQSDAERIQELGLRESPEIGSLPLSLEIPKGKVYFSDTEQMGRWIKATIDSSF